MQRVSLVNSSSRCIIQCLPTVSKLLSDSRALEEKRKKVTLPGASSILPNRKWLFSVQLSNNMKVSSESPDGMFLQSNFIIGTAPPYIKGLKSIQKSYFNQNPPVYCYLFTHILSDCLLALKKASILKKNA